MKSVRFGRAEAAALLALCDNSTDKFVVSARDKIALAALELKVAKVGCGVEAAHKAMETVLGKGKVALSPHADPGWFAKMSNAIKAKRLTVDDFDKMAKVLAGKGWAPPYSFERTVWAADRLLGDTSAPTGGGAKAAPTELDDL